jgi:hypothetical protein
MKRITAALLMTLLFAAARAHAQEHQHGAMADTGGWQLMQDAVVFVLDNHQGSGRGGDEVRAPNWWMLMAEHPAPHKAAFQFNVMLSADPATVTTQGYRELFQVGETYQGRALIDHQHPHDFLMQAAAIYRLPIANGYRLTLAGGPVAEPALGPVAFMHRASAAENPTAPLGHHTLDSTHVAMGVVTAGVDKGPIQIESSIFNGREPDEQRWDLMDPGALDSWSVRGWYRPAPSLAAQVSFGYLTAPEALEEGDVKRTTASLSWQTAGGIAITGAWGHNAKIGGGYNALLFEATRARPLYSLYTRLERTQVETDVLRTGVHEFQGGRKKAHVVEPGRRDFVNAITIGATRTIRRISDWDLAAGADLTGYIAPPSLTPFYGSSPFSAHVFLRVRPPAKHRMVEMTMSMPNDE